ncbi:MAG: sigma-70 family RNA polymerase sigma factor [Solirubrobacteraceae bacterium]
MSADRRPGASRGSLRSDPAARRSGRALGRRGSERVVAREYGAVRDEVLRTVGGKLRAAGVRLDDSDLDAAYNQAWHALYVKLEAGETIDNRVAMLVTITHRRALDDHRARHVDRRADLEPDLVAPPDDLDARLDDRTRLRALRDGMRERLSDRELEAATLCYLYDYTRPDAARQMGLTPRRMEKVMDGVSKRMGRLVEDVSGDWCRERRSMIRAYALGILDPDGERHALAASHLEDCSSCRRRVLGLRGIASLTPPVPLLVGSGLIAGGPSATGTGHAESTSDVGAPGLGAAGAAGVTAAAAAAAGAAGASASVTASAGAGATAGANAGVTAGASSASGASAATGAGTSVGAGTTAAGAVSVVGRRAASTGSAGTGVGVGVGRRLRGLGRRVAGLGRRAAMVATAGVAVVAIAVAAVAIGDDDGSSGSGPRVAGPDGGGPAAARPGSISPSAPVTVRSASDRPGALRVAVPDVTAMQAREREAAARRRAAERRRSATLRAAARARRRVAASTSVPGTTPSAAARADAAGSDGAGTGSSSSAAAATPPPAASTPPSSTGSSTTNGSGSTSGSGAGSSAAPSDRVVDDGAEEFDLR